jgi:hypothetical protein
MAQIPPWHSIRQRDANVFHDETGCPVGNEIDEKYRRAGHRCRQRCRVCARLRAEAQELSRLPHLMSL